MDIKLLNIYLNQTIKTDSKLLGFAMVQLSDKMRVMMNVFRGNNGNVFLKFPATKIGEEYKPHIEFINLNLERDISNVLGDEVTKRFNAGNTASTTTHAQSSTDFPF